MTAQSGLGFSGIVAIQIPDDGATGEVLTKLTPDDYDYDWAAGGAGSAPANATYVVMSLNGVLTDERVLTGGDGISIVDGGAGGLVTINMDGPVVAGTVDNSILRWNTVTPAWEEFTTYIFPLADGTDGQAIITDGAGTLSFSTIASGGGASTTQYRFSTSIVAADPGSGRFRYDNAVHALVTEIFIDDENTSGVDLSNFFALIEIGDRLYIQEENDAAKFQVWNVDGPAPVDNTGWWTISVELERDGDTLSNNARCIVGLQAQGNGDITYLRLDATNGPLTGDLGIAGDFTPSPGNQQRNIGLDDLRFQRMFSRLGVFVGESASSGAVQATQGQIRSISANAAGIMCGNQVRSDTGASEMQLQGGAYKSVATMGNTFAYSTGDAKILNTGGGALVGGSAFSYGAGDAVISGTGPGTFTWAYAYTGFGGTALNHTLLNSGIGSFLSGYSYGYGTINVTSSGQGSFCQGFFSATQITGTSVFRATGTGSFAQGAIANNAAATSTLEATGSGGFAQGQVQGEGRITASGLGSFAQGRAGSGGVIEATQDGAFAHGFGNVNDIQATADGAFAIGDATNGNIIASGVNACQFGPGTNSLADTLQIGNGGIRFKGTTGVPGALQNGDFWMDTTLRLRSDGASWNFDQSAAFTRNATVVEDRTLLASASATTLNNNNVLAALIADLQTIGALG